MKKLFFALISLISIGISNAQVSLAPTAVFLDKNGMGTLYITNNSEQAQEITVNFQFGYSYQDAKGFMTIVYDDSIRAKTNGLDNMIKAFPRAFNLPAKQQQIVRIQVRAPKDLPDGMYFSRLKVGSTGQAAEIGATENTGISTRVNVRYEQVIAAFYKKGNVTTGITLEGIEPRLDSNFLSLNMSYKTKGNAPYLGRMKAKVLAPNGDIIAEGGQTIAMYFDGKRKINFALAEAPKPGQYEVIVEFETKRSDITQEDLVQSVPYTYKTRIQLP